MVPNPPLRLNEFSLTATDDDNYTCYLDNNGTDPYFNCDHTGERHFSIELVKPKPTPTKKPTPEI